MAGEWIKVRRELVDSPRLALLWQRRLKDNPHVTMDTVLGSFVRTLLWADQHSLDGSLPTVAPEVLDAILGLPSWSRDLLAVGWLERRSDGLVFPDFSKHNTATTKARLDAAQRKQASRAKGESAMSQGDVTSVTDSRDKNGTPSSSSSSSGLSEEEDNEHVAGPSGAVVQWPDDLGDERCAEWLTGAEHGVSRFGVLRRVPWWFLVNGLRQAIVQCLPPPAGPDVQDPAKRKEAAWAREEADPVPAVLDWVQDFCGYAEREGKPSAWVKACLRRGPRPDVYLAPGFGKVPREPKEVRS